jgi:hypothetical protein
MRGQLLESLSMIRMALALFSALAASAMTPALAQPCPE